MSLSIALSGVQAAQTDIDTIGNNIANVSTTGFKASNAQFADIYSGAASGFADGPAVPGEGAAPASLSQVFTEGALQQTGNPLDTAISGNGFFQVKTGAGTAYTRDGEFHIDNNGFLITDTGAQVLGLVSASANSAAAPASLQAIQVNTGAAPATPTSAVGISVNLPATDTPIDTTATPFDPTNSASYNESTSFSVYDSLGASHALTTYFTEVSGSGSPNQWQTHWQLSDPSGAAIASGTGPGLTFSSSGQLQSGGGSITTGPLPNGAAALNIAEDFTGSGVSNLAFAVNGVTNNGSGAGQFSGVAIAANGEVTASYSNGATKSFGTVALANFADPQALTPVSNNMWLATPGSGTPISGSPNTGGLGTLQSGVLEGSNVDVSTQLVSLITAQQAYQANAQGISVEQQDIQRLLQIQ
ncbi:MAG: flagellar hook protein FlgE [Alphaproteobacteria bacterium]|nr:flagellar hook protein FlgE [Alphaproteobacteria bacterium]